MAHPGRKIPRSEDSAHFVAFLRNDNQTSNHCPINFLMCKREGGEPNGDKLMRRYGKPHERQGRLLSRENFVLIHRASLFERLSLLCCATISLSKPSPWALAVSVPSCDQSNRLAFTPEMAYTKSGPFSTNILANKTMPQTFLDVRQNDSDFDSKLV